MTNAERLEKQTKVRALAEELETQGFLADPAKLKEQVKRWLAYEWPCSLVDRLLVHHSKAELEAMLGFDPDDLRIGR